MAIDVLQSVMRSPWPAPLVPDTDFTDHVLRHTARLGSKPALIDAPSGRTITYSGLARDVRRAAAGLAARGFGSGDVLAVHMPNVPEYAVAVHAAMSLGGTVATANPLYTSGELAHQLRDSCARALLTVPPFLDAACEAARQAGCDDVLVLGEGEGATPFAELFEHGEDAPQGAIDPDSTAALLYSSGTTGVPKGVELSHRALIANVMQTDTVLGLDTRDMVLAVAPFFHALGFAILMNTPLASGSTVVSLPRFELGDFLQSIQDYAVTGTIVVPPIALALARHPVVEHFELSSLRFVGCGAAPLGIEAQRACAQRLGCPVEQGYGMTEATAGIAISSMVETNLNAPGQVGILLPGTEARVIEPESGDDLGSAATGEIVVRGPQLMSGYLGRPEATAATIDRDGWLHTGDIGRVDDEGHVYITDRLKELIKYKGYQVAPAELEALLVGHPQISAAAVIGAPDEEAGELPTAFVVAEPKLDDAALMAWVAERVAPHKRIRRVERVDEVPCSPSGKILRRELRARLGRPAAPEPPTAPPAAAAPRPTP
jgi:acyl-CoA synthetase (AMP-forming)/AMP-acid ligase II